MTIELFAQSIFFLSLATLVYTYCGYPLVVYIYSCLFPKKIEKKDIEPQVTVLITAYNEEASIRAKLENTLLIDYPKSKLEILVASDGSNDKTDEIVESFASRGVRLFHQTGRKGKTYTQNKAVEEANGEIILFSDATTMYMADVLREVLPNFADESIGCVAGKLIYVDNSDSDVGKGAISYWNYETFLKRSESRACSLIGASGCLYAVRKSAYQPMYDEACSDFLICTVLYRQGLRTIFEPNAICTEETNQRTDKEMKMRVRVISQTITDLWRNRGMMNPFRSGFYAIELISHKLLRYTVPLFLFLVFISTAFLTLSSPFFIVVLVLQIVFYFAAFFALLLEKTGYKIGLLAIPLYFVLTNFASVVAFYKFMIGERYTTWEPIRDSDEKRTPVSDQII